MFERSVKMQQLRPRLHAIELDGVTPAINIGGQEATLTDNGPGDYTLTLAKPLERTIAVMVTSQTADVVASVSSKTASAVRILCVDATDGTTPKDAVIDVMILGSDSVTEY